MVRRYFAAGMQGVLGKPLRMDELRRALGDALRQLQGLTPEQLVEQRVQRVLSYGAFQEVRA